MNMIPQAIEIFLHSISAILTPDTLTDFGLKMAQTLDATHVLLLSIIPEILLQMDEALMLEPKRKAEWEVVRIDKRELVTAFGTLCFTRHYCRNKKTGERAYLLDRHLGIEAHAKVNGDVRQAAITQAEQGSFSKSAAVSTVEELSRMSVCNYVKDLITFPALEATSEKRSVGNLYVEADEDHVALQNGKNTQVRLVYIHEGVEERGGRRKLINPRYITWPQGADVDEFWETVSNFIDKQYVSDDIANVFLSGDCAAWIRTGEEWLYPCVPILDGFHTMKALRGLCGSRQQQVSLFMKHVRDNEYEQAIDLFRGILGETPAASREAKRKQAKYLLGNWERIRNQSHPDAAGCSAEGHVSHILSERLSSRPCGWSEQNLENIARLRVMKANGQVISYNKLSRKKCEEQGTVPVTRAETLVKTRRIQRALKKSAQSYAKEACANLPILLNGKVSPIFLALKGLSLGNVAC
jgi:hypothetical protein